MVRRKGGEGTRGDAAPVALPAGAAFDDMLTLEERKAAFLEALRQSFTATSAARRAGIDRTTPYRRRKDDPGFGAQ